MSISACKVGAQPIRYAGLDGVRQEYTAERRGRDVSISTSSAKFTVVNYRRIWYYLWKRIFWES